MRSLVWWFSSFRPDQPKRWGQNLLNRRSSTTTGTGSLAKLEEL
jgi:hypothetical protein